MPLPVPSHLEPLPLDSLFNARDLGGVPLPDGRTTVHHRFLRSDETGKISDSDIGRLLAYPLELVIDLRTPEEIAQLPSRFSSLPGVRYENISLLGRDLDTGIGAVVPHQPGRTETTLGDLYIHMLIHAGPQIAAVFSLMAGQTAGATLFHCLHGKDRTGLVAALLLKLAGASEADIIANYAISSQLLWPWFQTFWHSIPFGTRRFLNTDPQHMEETLDFFNRNYADTSQYLRRIGVSAREIETLRCRLTAA